MGTWETGDRSVDSLYGWVLGRQGDQGGLDYWKGQFGDTVDDNELGIFGQAAVPELSTNTPSWMGEGTIRTGDGYYNTKTRTGYNPTYSGGGYSSMDQYTDPTLSGYRSYTLQDGMEGPTGNDKTRFNGTQYTDYGLEGNQTGTGTYSDITNRNHGMEIAKIFAAAAGMAGAQSLGLVGGTNPVLGDPVTGLANQGYGIVGGATEPVGSLFGDGLGGGVPGLGDTPGVFNAAQDSQAANVLLDAGELPGIPGGPGTALEGYRNPALLENLVNNPPVISNPPPVAPPGSTPPGTTPPAATPPGTTPPGSINIPGIGDIGLKDLLSLLGGGIDLAGQRKASSDMLDYLKSQQAKVDGLYAPGSNEYNTLWDQMSRKDAAAGRNSQYGPRSVDLASQIAKIKADNTVRMTTGIGSLYKNALDQEASAPAGLIAQLEKLLTRT
jgi:hypothetical protein